MGIHTKIGGLHTVLYALYISAVQTDEWNNYRGDQQDYPQDKQLRSRLEWRLGPPLPAGHAIFLLNYENRRIDVLLLLTLHSVSNNITIT